MTSTLPVWMICGYLAIMGIGLGMSMQILVLIVQNTFPNSRSARRQRPTTTSGRSAPRWAPRSSGACSSPGCPGCSADRMPAGAALAGGGNNSLTPAVVARPAGGDPGHHRRRLQRRADPDLPVHGAAGDGRSDAAGASCTRSRWPPSIERDILPGDAGDRRRQLGDHRHAENRGGRAGPAGGWPTRSRHSPLGKVEFAQAGGVMLDDSLQAVSDRTRRAILQRLAHGQATVGQIAGLFPMSRPATSRPPKVLKDAGLIGRPVPGGSVLTSSRRDRCWRSNNGPAGSPTPGPAPRCRERTQPIDPMPRRRPDDTAGDVPSDRRADLERSAPSLATVFDWELRTFARIRATWSRRPATARASTPA